MIIDADGRIVTSGNVVAQTPPIMVDVPAGYAVTYAERYDPDTSATATAQQLWANNPDDVTESAWVVISGDTSGATPLPIFDAGQTRLAVNEGVAVVAHVVGLDGDDTVNVHAPIADGTISIQARGVDDSSLAAVVNATTVNDGQLDTGAVLVDRGFHLLGATDGVASPARSMISTIGMIADDDPDGGIFVSAGQPLTSFDRAIRAFMLRDARVVTVGGVHTAIIGRDARDNLSRQAIVDLDGTEVVIGGRVDNDDVLLAVARSLRLGTLDDWEALRTAAERAQQRQFPAAQRTFLRSGTMTGAVPWMLNLDAGAARPASQVLVVDTTGPARGSTATTFTAGVPLDTRLATGGPGIQAEATISGVVLVAAVGRDHPGSRLVVTAGPLTLTDDLTDPGELAPGLFGAVGYNELVPYHAELVGAGGTVLATLDGM